MAEILILVLVALAVTSILAARGDGDDAAGSSRSAAAPAGSAKEGAAGDARHRPVEKSGEPVAGSDGTRYVQRDGRFGFVRSFGLDPRQLEELYVYTAAGRLQDLPFPVQDLLANLHERGCALGATITQFLFHGRALAEGEAIYVAVNRASARQPQRVAVAFIDRRRVC